MYQAKMGGKIRIFGRRQEDDKEIYRKDDDIAMEKTELLGSLTESQRAAVMHREGPMLVLAGPGSGKTRVITHRVAHLIQQGVRPYHILAITFTNKAAEEMRQRVAGLHMERGSTICTFHSLAARLLREFSERAGLSKNYSIYDTADQKAAIRNALKACELDAKNFPPGRMLADISILKNNLQTPEQMREGELNYYSKAVLKVYTAYQKILAANAALDFDDLLMKLALLLRDDVELRNRLNERYQYVLVDEYQDTNQCQYQIARGLSLNHNNLFVTGDPDQSIYGWRGADIGNILSFEKDYPEARVVRLEENFRSTPEVLALADQVIRQNTMRKEKRLFTSKPSGAMPELYEYGDEHQEAWGVTRWIEQLRQEGLEYRQIAIFYRINSMSRVLEEAFRRRTVPYQIVHGLEFFQRAEIKDLLAYLRFLVNPADQISLKRIINQPARGIGETSVERLFEYCRSSGRDIGQAIFGVEAVHTLPAAAKTKVKKFAELIGSLQQMLEKPVKEIVEAVYEKTGLAEALAGEDSEEKLANVEELINSAAEYDQEAESPSLADYLQRIALISDVDSYDEKAGAVSVMTLHAAKGLEFPAVAIIGVEDGLIPHVRSSDSSQELEEERRLLFVGITRAKKKLALSYARNRTIQGVPMATIRSQFLRGLEGLQCRSDRSDGFKDDYEEEEEDAADPYYEEDEGGGYGHFQRGQLVRHPKFGLGRIKEIQFNGEDTKVVVQFNNGSQKTLFLKYANLESLDF